MISILASWAIYAKIIVISYWKKVNLVMSKKAQKIVVWTMLIVMVGGIVASYAAMFLNK